MSCTYLVITRSSRKISKSVHWIWVCLWKYTKIYKSSDVFLIWYHLSLFCLSSLTPKTFPKRFIKMSTDFYSILKYILSKVYCISALQNHNMLLFCHFVCVLETSVVLSQTMLTFSNQAENPQNKNNIEKRFEPEGVANLSLICARSKKSGGCIYTYKIRRRNCRFYFVNPFIE